MTASVELHPAYYFDCDSCGREQMVRPIRVAITDEMRQDARDIMDLDVHEQAAAIALVVPERVTCVHCGSEFQAVISTEQV